MRFALQKGVFYCLITVGWILSDIQAGQAQIRYAPNPYWAPIDYVDYEGKHQGLIADYMALLQPNLREPFSYVHLSSWADMLRAIEAGEVDMIGAVHKTPERAKYLYFTESLFKLPIYLITNRKNRHAHCDPGRLKLAAVRGYASAAYIRNKYPNAQIEYYNADIEALLQTALGHTDATIMDLASANYYIRSYQLEGLVAECKLDFEWNICIGVTKSNPALFEAVQSALATIPFEKRDSLFYAFLSENSLPQASLYKTQKKTILLVSVLVLVALLVVLGNMRYLRLQVRQRTSELQNKTELFELASKAASDAIFEILPDENLLHFEEGFRTLFGYDENDSIDNFKNWMNYVHPDDRQHFYESAYRLVKSKEHFYKEDFRFKMANGLYCWVQLRCFLVRRSDGWVTRVVGAIQDISARREYLDAITRHNLRLQDIAWLQSHVIRAPLARLMSLVNILEIDGDITPEEQKQYLALINESAAELDEVIKEIADKAASIRATDD